MPITNLLNRYIVAGKHAPVLGEPPTSDAQHSKVAHQCESPYQKTP